MNREAVGFRWGSAVLAAVVTHYLCGGATALAAAPKEREARPTAAAALKLPAGFFEDPAGFQRLKDADAKTKRAAALALLAKHTESPRQTSRREQVRELSQQLERRTQASRLSGAISRAEALKLAPDAKRRALEAVVPGFKSLAAPKRVEPPALRLPEKPKRLRPPEPRTQWPQRGAVTTEESQLIAEAEPGARVVMPDGSELEASQLAVSPVHPQTRLASLMSDLGLGLPLLGVLPPPTPEDTAETPETRRTPAVQAALSQSGSDALALYNLVLTKVRPELYAGSKKGADATLREAAGNDFDTASLLIALLRGAGIPARYEYGSVALTQAQAEALTGAKTVQAAAQLLGSVGVPNAVTTDGTMLVMERAWVRAYVPWGDKRYGGGTGESLWVRLDAGLKLQKWATVPNLKGVATFSQANYLATPNARSPQAVYESQLLAVARAHSLCNTLDEALYLGTLTQPALTLLPAEHPGQVLASLLTFARPPPSMRWTATVEGAGYAANFELAELEYRTLALRYVGATAADEAKLSAAGDITNVLPWQVQVVPVLRLDGVEVARGTPSLVGTTQQLSVRTTVPQGSPRAYTHRVVAGGVYGVSLTGGVTTENWATERRKAMTGLATDSPEAFEAAAHAVQAIYANRSQTSARRLAALTGHVVVLDAFESLAGRQLLVTEANGLPISVRWGLYFISANDSLTPVPRDGDASQVENLIELFGLQGSAFESQAWEEVFSRRALSTVTIIQAARSQGVPVDTFTSGTVAVLSGYSSAAVNEMNEALSAGWKVTAPRHPVTFGGYAGAEGYILLNPVDGTGGYKVSFELNGGGSTGPDAPAQPFCAACAAASATVGSVVDVAGATWRESWVDLSLPGVGLPVVFGRTFASRADEGSTLGPRWMHTYATALREEPGGDLTWLQEDMRLARFALTAPNTWTAPAGYFQRLEARVGGGWRLTEKDGTSRDFDATGRLLRLADTSGNAVTCVYTGPLLTEVRDATGRSALRFGYVDGQLTDVTDIAGRGVHYSYSGGNLTGFTDATGQTESYTYDDGHRLVAYTDVRHFTRTNFYDAQGRWLGQRDALGGETKLLHDAIARRAVLYDKTGRATAYEWGPAGELLATIDAAGNEERVVRDANYLPLTQTDGRGLPTVMTYDELGNTLSVRHADGRSETYVYAGPYNKVVEQNATGLPRVTFGYDSAGRLLSRNDTLGGTLYTYTPRGEVQTVTAEGGATQRFGYDTVGNLTTVGDATGRTTTLGYDAAGHVTSTRDNAGHERRMAVDALGRLKTMTDELLRTTTFTLDEAGHRVKTRDALGRESTVTYDALGRVTETTDATQATRRTEYDAMGRVLATIDALKGRATRDYDAAGRLLSSTDEAGFTTTMGYCADIHQPCAEVDTLGHVTLREYDAVGRLKTETDDAGRVTTHEYDSGGRMARQSGPMQPPTQYFYGFNGLLEAVLTPVQRVQYVYDGRGNRTLVSVFAPTSSGVEDTQYTYDAANRLLSERNPLGQLTKYTYDAAGNRATKVDGKGLTTTYGYDDARRLTSVSFEDGTGYLYGFDEVGRRVLEASSTHQRQLTYDAVGRVKTVVDGLLGVTVESSWDAQGRRLSVTEGGVPRQYEYDARGLVRRMKLGAGGFLDVTHDGLGRRTSVVRPNGVRTDWLYDDVGQLEAVVHSKAGVVLEGFRYEYDTHGMRVKKTRFDGSFEVYGYDAGDRLVRVDDSSGKRTQYGLDSVGNRRGLTVIEGAKVTSTTSGFSDFNQVTSSSRSGGGLPVLETAYVYDSNGNLTTETAGAAVTTYGWDADNRLRRVAQPSLLSTFEYDANGLRTKKVEAGIETRFLLDGSSVLAEYDGANAATRRYLQNPESIDDILEFTDGGQLYFPLTDALGSVVAITDVTGAVVRRNSYEVYGARTSIGTGPDWAFGFTGREQDASGWRYHRDRYASAATGSWSQADRLGMAAGPGFYQYVGSSPARFKDPTGMLQGPLPILSSTAARSVPAYDSVTAYALSNPVSFLMLMVALGEVAESVLSRVGQECDDKEPQRVEIFYRGDSTVRASQSVTGGFISAGIGDTAGQRGFGLYMTRQEQLAHYYAQENADQYGSGSVLKITIASKIWRAVVRLGALDNVMMNSVWLETFVPTGPALGLFDAASAKGIVRTYPGSL